MKLRKNFRKFLKQLITLIIEGAFNDDAGNWICLYLQNLIIDVEKPM
jgi:hypothetical protein